MDSIIKFSEKLSAKLRNIFTGTTGVAGVISILAFLWGVYHLRQNYWNRNRPQQPPPPRQLRQQPGSSQSQRSSGEAPGVKGASSSSGAQQASLSPVVRKLQQLYVDVRRITISAPGVILVENSAAQLQDQATLRQEVVEVLQELLRCFDVFLIAQVEDDVGEATVRGALEACGLVRESKGYLAPQRILFCETTVGVVSIVRQLEPDLHIDALPETVAELSRFIPLVLHITLGNDYQVDHNAKSAKVLRDSSLTQFFRS